MEALNDHGTPADLRFEPGEADDDIQIVLDYGLSPISFSVDKDEFWTEACKAIGLDVEP